MVWTDENSALMLLTPARASVVNGTHVV
jgi:hypothetical protein